MSAQITTRAIGRAELAERILDLADLRIAVFRDWPYLYDGSREHERDYLQVYLDSPGAVVIGAFDGDQLVGAATGTPMEDHAGDFVAALTGIDLPLSQIFYGAESILLPEYRGQGIGHRFFDLREEHARALGRSHFAFCSVIRPDDHPLRPRSARSNEAFWRKRGYAPLPGAVAEFTWRDIGEAADSRKPLGFWIRAL